jgi:hypothetical protein
MIDHRSLDGSTGVTRTAYGGASITLHFAAGRAIDGRALRACGYRHN